MVGCTGVGENPSPPSVRPESTHLWYHKTNYSSLQSLGGSVANNQSVGYSCLCCYRSFSQLRRRTKLKHNKELKSVKNFSRCIFSYSLQFNVIYIQLQITTGVSRIVMIILSAVDLYAPSSRLRYTLLVFCMFVQTITSSAQAFHRWTQKQYYKLAKRLHSVGNMLYCFLRVGAESLLEVRQLKYL